MMTDVTTAMSFGFWKVNGEVFDLDRVLEGDCSIEFLNFDDFEGEWYYSIYLQKLLGIVVITISFLTSLSL